MTTALLSNNPGPHDDTSAEYEQFETKLLAQDRDITGVNTVDIDDTTAQSQINELLGADVVTPVPEDRVLVHQPSGTAVDSPMQLTVFHRGWTAACDADVEDD